MQSSFENDLKQFGTEINTVRKSKKITQLQLSSLCDVDIRTIQRIEKGEFNPSLRVLIRIANAFEMSLSNLIKQVEDAGNLN
ncbi:MAG: helix-turn-helix domain-containing protein [Crocinitomicaceae bacterium]|nr:helix-turn-helix domain-containing protein [Crocinitomicaceae bacterium]